VPLLLSLAVWSPLAAQEFIQQTLVVAPLRSDGDRRLARQVAASLRTYIARLSNKRELRVLDGDTTEHLLEFAGYKPDTVVAGATLHDLAHLLRADEIIVGAVTGKRGGPVDVTAELTLVRDWRMRQPLPTVHAATAAAAADSLAREVVRARTQMIGLRRCENAARSSQAARAVDEARHAVAGYPRSTLAKTCLATEMVMAGASADSVAAVTAEVLAVDSLNIIAAVLRAEALSAMKQPTVAAAEWGRVVALRPDSLELGVLAVEWMLRLREPAFAVTSGHKLLEKQPGEMQVRRLMFSAYSALADHKNAAALGDSLDAEDLEFRDDSVSAASHVAALRAIGDTLGAISKIARSVKKHPSDPILYLEYLQLVAGENSSAFQRGLERFPDVPDIHVLAAGAARATGNATNELAALREAVRLDSLMTRGYLRVAELWFSQHRVDSAVATLARAPRTGDGADLLRSYTVGRGMQVLRAGTPNEDVWRTTITLFAIADSVDSRADTRSLIAAVTMQLAQSELATATKTKQCATTKDAIQSLAWADAAIQKGVGEGSSADELRDAYTKLNAAAESMSKSFCAGPAGATAP
jgi:hypothetical protein